MLSHRKPPIAFVVKPGIYSYLTEKLKQEGIEFKALGSVEIFLDLHQEEEILAFFDYLYLRCYLNRFECPEAITLLLVKKDLEEARRVINEFLEKEREKIRNNSEKG